MYQSRQDILLHYLQPLALDRLFISLVKHVYCKEGGSMGDTIDLTKYLIFQCIV